MYVARAPLLDMELKCMHQKSNPLGTYFEVSLGGASPLTHHQPWLGLWSISSYLSLSLSPTLFNYSAAAKMELGTGTLFLYVLIN